MFFDHVVPRPGYPSRPFFRNVLGLRVFVSSFCVSTPQVDLNLHTRGKGKKTERLEDGRIVSSRVHTLSAK